MYGIGKGFRYLYPQYLTSPDGDGGGGAGPVQELPEVPGPSDDDIDALSGEDDDGGDADGDEDASGDGDDDSSDEDADADDDSDEDEDKDDKKDKKKKDDKEDKIDEDEDEDEDEDKKEDKEPKGDPNKVPSIKALKTAYPDIFKKFPHVRTAIAEHQQFRAFFSSPDEAREAVDAQDNFASLTDKVVDEGDFGFLFDEVQRADPAAAARLAKKVLPALLERNRDLYMEVTEAPITQFVHAAYRRGQADGNKNLLNSALHIWKFLGRDGTPSAQETGPDPKDQEFQQRVKEFEGRKFSEARTSVNQAISADLAGLIEQQIDPKGTLKPTIKKALVNELIRLVDADVSGDQNHMSRVERLWANARRSSYAAGHLSRITSAYLERAKQVLPKHARKVREENNIKDEPRGDKKDERRPAGNRDSNQPPPRPNAQGNPPRQKTIRDTNPRDIDWNKTSDEDVLSGKAVLRRRQ